MCTFNFNGATQLCMWCHYGVSATPFSWISKEFVLWSAIRWLDRSNLVVPNDGTEILPKPITVKAQWNMRTWRTGRPQVDREQEGTRRGQAESINYKWEGFRLLFWSFIRLIAEPSWYDEFMSVYMYIKLSPSTQIYEIIGPDSERLDSRSQHTENTIASHNVTPPRTSLVTSSVQHNT